MFRCSGCGKWSHAKKQPKGHARWVKPGDPLYDPEKNENDWGDAPDGHYVECGPFVSYIAVPVCNGRNCGDYPHG
jgi:hypothetical protein